MKNNNSFFSRLIANRTVSLRYFIVLPFVFLIVFSTTIIALFSLQNGRITVNDVARQLRAGVLARVEDRLTEYLQIPLNVNEVNVHALESGLLDIDDLQNVQRYFYSVIKANPYLAYSFLGTTQGEFYGARRLPDGKIQIVRAGDLTNGNSHNFSTNPLGDALELKQVYKNFDPRTRPWYQAGVAAKGPAWTPIYRHFVIKDLALTAAQAFYDSNGNLKGVFAVDYVLGQIDKFLKTIRVSEHGEVYIMDDNGDLIAASSATSGYLTKDSNGIFTRVPAVNSGVANVETSARLLKEQTEGLKHVGQNKLMSFEQNGELQYLQASEFTRIPGLKWILVTIVPESDLMARINANTSKTLAIIGLVVIFSVALGIFMVSRMLTPIEKFSRDAEKLARGDFDIKPITHTNVNELSNLDLAFQAMGTKLQYLFKRQKEQSDIIAKQNESLEKSVAERTVELKSANSRLKAFFENIPGHVNVVDKEFNIIAVSRGLLEDFGFDEMDSILGFKCYEVFQGNSSPCAHCSLFECYRTKKTVIRYSTTEEESITGKALQIYSGAILDENNEIIGGIEYVADISDLRALEKELITAREKAELANRAKSDFLAHMSHEIRTPINAVINMNRLLLDTPLDENQKDYAKTAMLSSEILLFLINDILDFSKIEAGKLELENTPFNLLDTVESVVKIMESKAEEKELYLTHQIEPDVYPYLIGDPVRVRQVLLNFISNAVKFTEKGGINVTVFQKNINKTDTTVKFKISDTGIGISEEHKKRLFHSFSQEDSSTSRKYGGTGLGLAISKKLVALMGGEVGVVSEKNVGSTFHFTVTFKKNTNYDGSSCELNSLKKEGDAASRGAMDLSTMPHAEILLVEDNIMNQKVALALLNKFDFLVDIANNGREAVDAARRKHYDLIFMDMQMPEMDGIEATKIIRNCDSPVLNPNVPIISMTANATKNDRQKCYDAGMNAYLSKPIDPEELLSVIKKYLVDTPPNEDKLSYFSEAIPTSFFTSKAASIFDHDAFLKRLGGSETLFMQLASKFPSFLSKNIKQLKEAVNREDAETIRMCAHATKGICANFSANRLCDMASLIEDAAKEGKTDVCFSLMKNMEQEFIELESVLSNMFPDIFPV
nr:response regulator [Desulfobulbaceae bacterium]